MDVQGIVAPAPLAQADDGNGAFLGVGRQIHVAERQSPRGGVRQIQEIDGRSAVHHEAVGIGAGLGTIDIIEGIQEVCGHEGPELIRLGLDNGLGAILHGNRLADFTEGMQPPLVGAHQDEPEVEVGAAHGEIGVSIEARLDQGVLVVVLQ